VKKYQVLIDKKKAVYNFMGTHQIACVTGAFFGDEAKGKMVDELSKISSAIARVNSGENAGHTVYYKKKKFVFHLTPSAVMTKKKTFIGKNCVMDPISFMREEIALLIKNKIAYQNLKIGNVFIVHPLHKLVDILRNPNASTGKGMSAVHQDIIAKRGIRLEDFLNKNYTQLEKSINFWFSHLKKQGLYKRNTLLTIKQNKKIPPHVKHCSKLTTPSAIINYIINNINKTIKNKHFPIITDPQAEMTNLLNKNKKILLEGSQSFYLSNSEGTHYTTSTSANTNNSGIYASSGLPLHFSVITLNVTKVPSSRVGSGANPSGYVEQDWFSKQNLFKKDLEKLDIDFKHSYKLFLESINKYGQQKETSYTSLSGKSIKLNNKTITVNQALAISSCLVYEEFGATTGKPRICGSLDLLHLKRTLKYQGKYLSITALDRLDKLSEVLVINKYKYTGPPKQANGLIYRKGRIITTKNELPPEEILKYCQPIYKKLAGWQTSKPLNKTSLDKNLNNFLRYIEKQTKAKIISFGNGPQTKDLVYLK
jgi:adenylosuccinate synthase